MTTTVKIIDQMPTPYVTLGEYATRAEADQARAGFEAQGYKYLRTEDPASTWTTRDRATGRRETFASRWDALDALVGTQDSTGHTVTIHEG